MAKKNSWLGDLNIYVGMFGGVGQKEIKKPLFVHSSSSHQRFAIVKDDSVTNVFRMGLYYFNCPCEKNKYVCNAFNFQFMSVFVVGENLNHFFIIPEKSDESYLRQFK